jgi:alpha-beta hydrolase superfamily lysophospholipase
MSFHRFIFNLIFLAVLSSSDVMAQSFELVSFGTKDGGKIEAALFAPANNETDSKVVIFAHGAIFDKESWYFLAEAFQQAGISALAIDFRGYGNSTPGSSAKKMYDILGAISYLDTQGFTDINVVGASMGGAAVLLALDENTLPIQKAVLMAPAGGPAIRSTVTEKLFIVSENERMFSRVMAIHAASAEPKQVQVYPGNAHAQHMFKTDVRDELIERIMNFIMPNKP